jgi:hypothetical protein
MYANTMTPSRGNHFGRQLTAPQLCGQDDIGPTLPSAAPATFDLTAAVPSGMVATMANRYKRRKARPGDVARFFNVAAGRPYPHLSSLQQQIQVTLSGTLPTWLTTSTSLNTFATKQFSLPDLGGSSSFLTVFDQYRFDQIEIWLEPQSGTGVGGYPIIASCVDLDDANVPTTFNSVADHQVSLVGEGQAGRYHKWKPHMAVAAYSGAFTSYANEPANWIDSASTAVQHYGFKVAALNGPVSYAYGLSFRVLLSFRGPGIN